MALSKSQKGGAESIAIHNKNTRIVNKAFESPCQLPSTKASAGLPRCLRAELSKTDPPWSAPVAGYWQYSHRLSRQISINNPHSISKIQNGQRLMFPGYGERTTPKLLPSRNQRTACQWNNDHLCKACCKVQVVQTHSRAGTGRFSYACCQVSTWSISCAGSSQARTSESTCF